MSLLWFTKKNSVYLWADSSLLLTSFAGHKNFPELWAQQADTVGDYFVSTLASADHDHWRVPKKVKPLLGSESGHLARSKGAVHELLSFFCEAIPNKKKTPNNKVNLKNANKLTLLASDHFWSCEVLLLLRGHCWCKSIIHESCVFRGQPRVSVFTKLTLSCKSCI